MDIRIILNAGAVGTPKAVAQQLSDSKPAKEKKTKGKVTSRRGTPARAAKAPASSSGTGSAIRLRSSSSTETRTNQKSYDEDEYETPVRSRHQRPPASSSPLVRQTRPKKRALNGGDEFEFRGEEAVGRGRSHKQKQHNPSSDPRAQTGSTKRWRAPSQTSSATTVSASPSLHSRSRSHASILLSRAREHVALETIALGGRRTRSFMDVVMDLKGPAEQDGDAADVDLEVMLFADEDAAYGEDGRGGGGGGGGGFVLTADGALEAYWAGQAAIWVGVGSASASEEESDLDGSGGGTNGNAHITLTRFPVSMERSTARATWESASP